MSESTPALLIEDFSYSYRSEWTRSIVHAVTDLHLSVGQGESFGFLGHNGAGKTSTIKAILGLTRPTKGTIQIFGQSHLKTESRSHVGYLPEQPYFYDHLTVFEALSLYASLARVARHTRRNRINEVIEQVGLKEKTRARMRALSKGLTQRVALAQAIIASPKLLVLDEPFSGLDPLGRYEFRQIFLDLKRQGTTLFFSSHILGDIENLCDRASILVKGRLQGIYDLQSSTELQATMFVLIVRGSVRDLAQAEQGTTIRQEGNVTIYEFSDRSQAEQALHMALHRQVPVEVFEAKRPHLEDIFLNVTNQQLH